MYSLLLPGFFSISGGKPLFLTGFISDSSVHSTFAELRIEQVRKRGLPQL
jgi:hypothetical protein